MRERPLGGLLRHAAKGPARRHRDRPSLRFSATRWPRNSTLPRMKPVFFAVDRIAVRSGRRRDPRRRRRARRRRAASGKIRPFRSLCKNVGGDDNRPGQGLGWRNATRGQGRLCRGQRPRSATTGRGIDGKRVGGGGIPRAGCGGGTGRSDGACRCYRTERPAPRPIWPRW